MYKVITTRKTINSNPSRTFSKCPGLKLMLTRIQIRKINKKSKIRPLWTKSMKEILIVLSRRTLIAKRVTSLMKISRSKNTNIRRALKSQRMIWPITRTRKTKRRNNNRSSTGLLRLKFLILWLRCRVNRDNIGIS